MRTAAINVEIFNNTNNNNQKTTAFRKQAILNMSVIEDIKHIQRGAPLVKWNVLYSLATFTVETILHLSTIFGITNYLNLNFKKKKSAFTVETTFY